jgi:uncharacterized membrane protein
MQKHSLTASSFYCPFLIAIITRHLVGVVPYCLYFNVQNGFRSYLFQNSRHSLSTNNNWRNEWR